MRHKKPKDLSNETNPNIWYAMTPSPASLTSVVRRIRKAPNSLAEKSCNYIYIESLIKRSSSIALGVWIVIKHMRKHVHKPRTSR